MALPVSCFQTHCGDVYTEWICWFTYYWYLFTSITLRHLGTLCPYLTPLPKWLSRLRFSRDNVKRRKSASDKIFYPKMFPIGKTFLSFPLCQNCPHSLWPKHLSSAHQLSEILCWIFQACHLLFLVLWYSIRRKCQFKQLTLVIRNQ